MRGILLIGLFVLSVTLAYGQSTKSVIRLKNGVLLKGEIVEFVQDDYMILHVMEGQDMRIPIDYVRSFKIKKGKLAKYNLPEEGFFNYTHGGFIFLKSNSYDAVDVNMSVHMVNGYRYNHFYSAGIGIGLDRYGTSSAMPVYLSLRRDFSAKRVSPIVNVNAGYGWMWESDSYNDWDDFEDVKGGFHWEIGTGLRINYEKTALIFKYAYKRQNSELTIVNDDWWRREDIIEEKHKFRNMTLTAGLEF